MKHEATTKRGIFTTQFQTVRIETPADIRAMRELSEQLPKNEIVQSKLLQQLFSKSEKHGTEKNTKLNPGTTIDYELAYVSHCIKMGAEVLRLKSIKVKADWQSISQRNQEARNREVERDEKYVGHDSIVYFADDMLLAAKSLWHCLIGCSQNKNLNINDVHTAARRMRRLSSAQVKLEATLNWYNNHQPPAPDEHPTSRKKKDGIKVIAECMKRENLSLDDIAPKNHKKRNDLYELWQFEMKERGLSLVNRAAWNGYLRDDTAILREYLQ